MNSMTHQRRKGTTSRFLSSLVLVYVTPTKVGYSCTIPTRFNSSSSTRLLVIASPCRRSGWLMIREWLSLVLLHQVTVSCSLSLMSLYITSPSRHVILMLKSGTRLCSRISYRLVLSSRLFSPTVFSTASQTLATYRSLTRLQVLGTFFFPDNLLKNIMEATDVS